jgi:hypothetical protein
VAYKIQHRSKPQELRFPTQRTAERYVDQFGGDPKQWSITQAGPMVTTPAPTHRPPVVASP